MESAFTSIVSVIGMVYVSTDRTGLTCVCRVYILNGYACQFCLVFYELREPIE